MQILTQFQIFSSFIFNDWSWFTCHSAAADLTVFCCKHPIAMYNKIYILFKESDWFLHGGARKCNLLFKMLMVDTKIYQSSCSMKNNFCVCSKRKSSSSTIRSLFYLVGLDFDIYCCKILPEFLYNNWQQLTLGVVYILRNQFLEPPP